MTHPLPDNEVERLRALARYDLLDTPPEASFDRITALAAKIFSVPIALVSLVASDRQWFKSKQGLDVCQLSRGESFCSHTIMHDEVLVISDTLADPRFSAHPLVTGKLALRFYAGAPLVTPDGYRIGALCLADTVPRVFSDGQLAMLEDLARMVIEAFDARRANVLIAAEIAQRKEADEARHKAEARKTAIFNASLDAIITIDHTGNVLEFNPAAERMFGVSAADATGREMAEIIIPPAYRAAHRRSMAHFLATGEGPVLNRPLELPALRADGSEFPVELIITRIASDGPPVFTGFIRDLTARRAVEERLRLLESSVAHANDAIIITDASSWDEPTPRILYVNEAFTNITGYSSEEAVGRSPRMLQGSDTCPETRREIRRALETWQPIRKEILNYHKDGSEFWIELNIVPVADSQGVYTHCVSVQRDTTERRRIEQAHQLALAEAETAATRLRTVLESISDAFFSLDRRGHFSYVNHQAENLLRRERGSLIGHNIWEQFPDLVGGTFAREFDRAMETRESARFEKLYPGLNAWFEVNVYPSEDGLSVYFRDITASKQAQRQIEDSHTLLRAVIDGTDNIIFLKDCEGRYLLINPAGAAILGRTTEEIIGQDDYAIFPDSDAAAIQSFDQEVMGSRRSITYEMSDTINGMEHAFLSTKSPYLDASGKLLGVIGIVREVTAQRRAQEAERRAKEEAEKANNAKSEFLSRMSHELRTPLNAILGFAQLLELADNLPKRQSESVGHILKAGRHLLALIDEVLAISRIEAGKMDLSLEPVPVATMVQECLSLVSIQARERGIVCRNEAAEQDQGGTLHVLADQQRLRQVLLNFLSNAIKYNRPEGQVVFSCQEMPPENGQGPGRARLSVKDTGHGLSAEDVKKLFVPFERLGAAESATEGTGLGLALSKALVEAIGGRVGVESVLGEGSTFWVELPLTDGPVKSRSREDVWLDSPSLATSATTTILYVEDNLSNLRLIQILLEGSPNLRLLSAEQGALGLELARASRPDLILLDLHLPDMPGWEVLRALRADERTRDIPTVIISADATPGRIDRLMQAGASAYLTKPINVAELMRVIREHLEVAVPAGI